jgi:uracil-DNA glycosylase
VQLSHQSAKSVAVSALVQLRRHLTRLRACDDCPNMIRPVVTGNAVLSPVMLIGQAPGAREGPAGKPFAWTAGKTLFGWVAQLGLPRAAAGTSPRRCGSSGPGS